jgi:hypothetical protein
MSLDTGNALTIIDELITGESLRGEGAAPTNTVEALTGCKLLSACATRHSGEIRHADNDQNIGPRWSGALAANVP